ncbi:DUF445 domain-containing protein [Iodobacter sp. BJB302]|uniref:DUF445 domain-containing protein n=1 Tax=Iodobacter sp. BJB302 TaxID=1506510 RepID=UPI0015D48CA0|nr:DUF445 domain-containing protein [Iodobacter sp. BJB302]
MNSINLPIKPMTSSNHLYQAIESAEIALKRQKLKQAKLLPLALLLFFAVVFVISAIYKSRYPALAYITAFAEAAMVGALADWFAVVALFRRPLGLPIPHTAIVPRNKLRIADSMGSFIQSNFLSPERIVGKIREFNPALKIAAWLTQNARPFSNLLIRALSYSLNSLHDGRLLAFLKSTLITELQRIDISQFSGHVLESLTQNGRHHHVLSEVLHELQKILGRAETQEAMAHVAAEEISFLKYMVLDKVAGKYLAEKMLGAVQKELKAMQDNPDHHLRLQFDRYIADFVNKLKYDAEFKQRGEKLKNELLAHPAVGEYIETLWSQLLRWLHSDLHRVDSTIRANIMLLAADMGKKLNENTEMQEWINTQCERAIPPIIEEYRETIGVFISDQVKTWDEQYMVERIELNIGTDLQFIRVSGTLVGGLVGLMIYVVAGWLG